MGPAMMKYSGLSAEESSIALAMLAMRLVEVLAAIEEQRLVEAVALGRAEHALGVGLFPLRVGQRQDAVVVEVDQPVFQARFRENRQRHRRGDPIVRIVVIAVAAVGDAAVEPALHVGASLRQKRRVAAPGQENDADT